MTSYGDVLVLTMYYILSDSIIILPGITGALVPPFFPGKFLRV